MFTLVVLEEKEILAEKLRALINRGEPRDFYDLWVLISKNVEIDKKLIFKKLKEEKSKISELKLPSKEEYEIALKELVNVLPPYEQAKKEVLKVVEKLK
ncbi:hypothetical protein A3K73_04100 [Candidatus Pacearchaeota archaeon RBG_13_36_9]|nr:MAG: hypothetical protein A3K73_04100 [Candidatus Pacearchaeota archaeon RBG_13_36_9]